MNDLDLVRELDRLYLEAKRTNDPDLWSQYEILRAVVDARLGIVRKDAA
jgi:hypothetical protein